MRELVKRSFAPIDDGDKSKNIFAGILRMSEAGDTIDHVFNTLLQVRLNRLTINLKLDLNLVIKPNEY